MPRESMKYSSEDMRCDAVYCVAKRSAMSLYVNPAHKRASRVLGFALTLDNPASWYAASSVWQARLTPQETAVMAVAALNATESELEQSIAEEALYDFGVHRPSFGTTILDAGVWADLATSEERAAYAVACVNRFTAAELSEFRSFLARQ